MNNYTKNPNSTQLIERIHDGLNAFDVDERTDWLTVGFALKHATTTNELSDPVAFQIWNDWSSKSSKHNADECRNKWDSSSDLTGEGVSLGTILQHAHSSGSATAQQHDVEATYKPNPEHSFQFQLRDLFLDTYPNCMWIENEKQWVLFNDTTGHWNSANLQCNDLMQKTAERLVKLIKCEDRNEQKKLRRSARNQIEKGAAIHSTLDLCRAKRDGSGIKFDTHKHLLGIPSGVLDLSIGKTRPAYKEEYVRKSIDYIPIHVDPHDVESTPHTFLDLIDHVAKGNEQERDFLLSYLAYCLTGETKEERFVLLIGKKGTGKNSFLQILNTLLGDEFATDIDPNNLIQSKQVSHKQWLANLQGYRVAMIPEFPQRRMDTLYTKILTSGERIKANKMRQDDVQFYSQLKLFLHSNFEPKWTAGDGIERRIIVIKMDDKPQVVDVDLKDKIENERAAILGFLVPYAKRYYECGLPAVPERWQKDTTEYIDEQDSVATFIKSHRYIVATKLTYPRLVSEVHEQYVSQCKELGTTALGKRTFNKELEKHGFKKSQNRSNKQFEWINIQQDEE